MTFNPDLCATQSNCNFIDPDLFYSSGFVKALGSVSRPGEFVSDQVNPPPPRGQSSSDWR